MRVDCRHYVRDLALAATLFAALGLTSAAYAQSLNASANIKNPKFVLDPSWPQAVAGSCYQRRGSSMGARRTTASTRI